MKPPPFTYLRAESLDHALRVLAERGEKTKPLAGGQSLVPMMNLRLARPDYVLDIAPIDVLRSLRRDDGAIEIGAMTTHADVEQSPLIARDCPLLGEAVRHVAHPPIRARGTVGGSIAHADPSAELPVVLVALGGEVRLRSAKGERVVSAGEFFKGSFVTAAVPEELVTHVRFPAAGDDEYFAFEEFARRRGDFALAQVACLVRRGAVPEMRIALGSVAPTPILIDGLSDLALAPAEEAAEEAAARALQSFEARGDIHATAEYRCHLVSGLVKRAVRRAVVQQQGGP